MRKIIAQRLAESKFTAPHFYLKTSVEMDQLMSARKQINLVSPIKISINDMMIKAVSLSLVKHPAVNSSWMGILYVKIIIFILEVLSHYLKA